MKLIRNDWEVIPLPLREAKDFIAEHHYAKGSANTAVSTFGLFYKGDPNTLHGVSVWMPPPLGAAKSVCLEHRSVLALSRFCLVPDRPENAGSFLIAKSIKMLDDRWNMLLTYADTALHHDGGLYRASNWNFNGMTKKNPIYWDPMTNSMVSRKKGPKTLNQKEMFDLGYRLRGKFAKLRYIYKRSERKHIIINSRQTDELMFTHDGFIYKG